MDNVNLQSVPDSVLARVYARAQESLKKDPAFVDEVAVDVIEHAKVNRDFSKVKKAKFDILETNSKTIILDREIMNFIEMYPFGTIINLSCALDNTFSRVDNGKIKWYNVDTQDVLDIRSKIFEPHHRVKDIACAVNDTSWINCIKNKKDVLIVAEGISMYMTEYEIKQLFNTISSSFTNATLLIELMNKKALKISKNSNKIIDNLFKWTVDDVKDFSTLCPDYKYVDEYDVTNMMSRFSHIIVPVIAPIIRLKNNRIGKFIIK